MNVLLAEADVSYDIVKEMDEINDDFPEHRRRDGHRRQRHREPERARPIRRARSTACRCSQVWKAGKVVMLKRGMAAGYAGVDNPLVYNDNTLMLFGDARTACRSCWPRCASSAR